MTRKEDEKKRFRRIDAMAKRGTTELFGMSPNDVLVQISLPLILILAIVTRLMMVGQELSKETDEGPIILDLWKQQLILRLDKVLDGWEQQSGLSVFRDFSRVQWGDAWPEDRQFQTLCRQAKALDNIETLKRDLYVRALQYNPDAEAGESGVQFWELYDPEFVPGREGNQALPPELTIDRKRRQYALERIEERCRQWKEQIESLEWSAIDRVADSLPINHEISDKNMTAQMRKLAAALSQKGYPLLNSVVGEYETKD